MDKTELAIATALKSSLMAEKKESGLALKTKESLLELVKKTVSMHRDGIITEDEFINIISYICSVFIESEVENRVSKVLDKKIRMTLKAFTI